MFDVRDGDFLVYKLSWAFDDLYKIQYDIINKVWLDKGTGNPTEVIDRGVDVLIRAVEDGHDELGIFDNPYFEPASPLVFKPGGFWVSFSIDNAYVFKERNGDFLIYQLNFNSDIVYLIQYDIGNRAWVDLGTDQPHEIIIQGSEILLRSDGYPNLGTFDDPYFVEPESPPPEPEPDPTPLNTPDVSDDEPFVNVNYIPFESGAWMPSLPGYEFHSEDVANNKIIYYLKNQPGIPNSIRYNKTSTKWEDGGDSNPDTVTQDGSQVTLSNPEQSSYRGRFTDPYYQAQPPQITSSGGTVSYAEGYTIHTFTSSGDFLISQNVNVEYLVVAGGGGGGYGFFAGGGGAGGFMEGIGFNTGGGSVIIGGGGSSANSENQPGGNGSNSGFESIIANGGGGGGSRNAVNGIDGGSGGGGCKNNGSPGLTNQLGAGNHGGIGNSNTAGGGGGAGGMGEDGITDSYQPGRRGGDGRSSGISGTIQFYSGGGGAGSRVTAGLSTSDIGGQGGTLNPSTEPTSGNVNTGSGGGGGGGGSSPGASGGSGIVIIRYITSVSPN